MPIKLVRVPKPRDTWVIANTYSEELWSVRRVRRSGVRRWTVYVPQEFRTRAEAERYARRERKRCALDADESRVMRKAQALIEFGEEVLQ